MAVTNTVTSLTSIIRGLVKDRLQNDGNNVFEYSTDNKFELSESFIQSSSIVVYQNGTVVDSSDYSFNSDTNQVTISFVSSGQSLTSGDIIRITYNYYSKYSDAEIQAFIESSLAYFVQHKYKKTFEVVSDLNSGEVNIVTVNGIDPTIDELYFICIIASILIDPQNIAVDVGGAFDIESVRSKSDQEQIREAFAHFKRFVGSINFELLERDVDHDQ